jgi:hypothetical protein
MKAAAVVLIGVILGVTAAAGDSSIGLGTSDAARVLAWIPNLGCLWVGMAFLVGAWFRRPWMAAVAGCGALAAAVIAYYTFGLTLGDRVDVGFAGVRPYLLRWLVAALIAGPAFGVIGYAFRRGRGGAGLLGAVALPAAVIAESGYYLAQGIRYGGRGGRFFGNDPWREGMLVCVLAVGVALAILFVRRWRVRQAASG